jgi:predicted site-specific integrase-resolvase
LFEEGFIMSVTFPFSTTGELAEELGVQGWRIARLFELGLLPEPPRCGGRRVIPEEMVPDIVALLEKKGVAPKGKERVSDALDS